jgi:hypothetical protein
MSMVMKLPYQELRLLSFRRTKFEVVRKMGAKKVFGSKGEEVRCH